MTDRQKIAWMIALAILAGIAVILLDHWIKGDLSMALPLTSVDKTNSSSV
ncbi:hypothetical protein NKH57_20750 [Mesorhizobium sp. M1050]